jgi:hypothetical protein
LEVAIAGPKGVDEMAKDRMAADSGLSSTTLADRLGVLEGSFLEYRLKPFFENLGNMVVTEVAKQASDRGEDPALHSYRAHRGRGIDLILERDREPLRVEIELPGQGTSFAQGHAGFKVLCPRAGRGLVIYGGDRRIVIDEHGAVLFGSPRF